MNNNNTNNNSNQQTQSTTSGQQTRGNTQTENQNNVEATNHESNQSRYISYPRQQGYPQLVNQYPSVIPGYPTQYGTLGGGIVNPNYAHSQPISGNNNQTAYLITQSQTLILPLKNYTCLAVFALFLFCPTGIIAMIRASEALTQYSLGNFAVAHACNESARKFIKISATIFTSIVLVTTAIVVSIILTAGG